MAVLLISLILSACGPSQEEMDVTSTQFAADLFSTLTAEAPTHTATPLPTHTSTPTLTPTVTATPPDVGSTMNNPVDDAIMMFVPAGEFIMGSENGESDESPVHTVWLDAFWVYQTVVTNAMFEKFVEATGYQTDAEKNGNSNIYKYGSWDIVQGADWQHPLGPDSDLSDLGDHPVVHVSWFDAQSYCDWADARLPTEAQWEKAARGTQSKVYPWGDFSLDGNLANFADSNTGFNWSNRNLNDGYSKTAPVGSYPRGASPYGLLDMAGNVYEWVADWYDGDYYRKSPSDNPAGPESSDSRVLRGGAWSGTSFTLRTTYRSVYTPPFRSYEFVGFRCALSSP
jgi:formylglycine-generating enzyme required for sulfatase activity